MIVRAIELEGFRSHHSARFEFGPAVNIVHGPNGRGKTNLLEGVFLLSGVRSWRTGLRRELIGWEAPQARLNATVHRGSRDYNIAITLPRTGSMTATINGARAVRQNPLSDVMRAVLFSPEDVALVKGAPSTRRDFIDSALMQLRPRYGALLNRYQKLLSGKSRLLKAEQQHAQVQAVLPEYNALLASVGARLIGYRADFCRQLGEQAGKVHSAISNEKEHLTIEYKTVSTVLDPLAPADQLEAQLAEHLASHQAAELAAGTCLSGVHRDDLVLSINGKLARPFASQGQARSAALALRFAQREIFFQDSGEHPVLLLDDVLSELDEQRRDFVCRHTLGGQSIITCCQIEPGFDGAWMLEV